MSKLTRIFEYLDGNVKRMRTVSLQHCECNDQRGPKGGVCGNCGGAIPSELEEKEK